MYLVYDIEAVAESEIADMWEKEKEGKNDRYPGREPFPPIWCWKVITIGMLVLDDNFMTVKFGCAADGLQGGKDEAEMIGRWSAVAAGRDRFPHKLVDYNGKGFDLPVLQTRAFRYGIQLPWLFSDLPDNRGEVSKYSKEYRDRYKGWHLDVQELWTNHNSFRYPHLANLAKLMGLPGKTGLDGSQIEQAYKDKRYADIDNYCLEDVFQTAFVFMRFQFLTGKINLEQYLAAARSLLLSIAGAGAGETHAEFLANIDKSVLFFE